MSNSIDKIIFLLDLPLDKRLFNLFGIEILLRNGFDVEIWDLSPFLYKEVSSKMVLDGEMVFDQCKKFDNKRDIVLALSEITANTIVNSLIAYQYSTFFIYRFLSKKNIIYCGVQMISLPSTPTNGTTLGFFLALVKKIIALKPKNAFLGLYNKILLKYYFLWGIRPANFVLMSGERSFEVVRDPIGKKTIRIWCHALDYDTYLKERKYPITPDPTLGIFLDEYYPLHTDLDYLGVSSPIGADEYYSKLCIFFDYLEKTHNVRIVIAAHPRSNYSESTPYFGGREIIKGQTARLVHESSFVLAHDSTSISFAVLFRKPIIFITMDKMQKCDAGRLTTALSIESMAHALGKTPINIDTMVVFEWAEELKVDMCAYDQYQNDIIKKNGTLELPFWEIYSKAIRQI